MNNERSRWTVTGNTTEYQQQLNKVECVNKEFGLNATHHFAITCKFLCSFVKPVYKFRQQGLIKIYSFFVLDLRKPEVQSILHPNGTVTYRCSCKGHPEPLATWTREPRLEKSLLSRIKRSRAHSRGYSIIIIYLRSGFN